MTLLKTYLLILLLVSTSAVFPQLPHGGSPYRNSLPIQKSAVKPIILEGFNIQKAIDESLNQASAAGKKPFRFAWNYPLSLTPDNSGSWVNLPDGTSLWRIHLRSPKAIAVNVEFSKYQLKPGCILFIYPPNSDSFLGGFNFKNNNTSGNLPTEYIKGEELMVEMQVEPGVSDYGQLEIGSLSHAYIDVFSGKATDAEQTSGSCNIDINCPEGDNYQLIKKAVCRIIFKVGSSSEFCTGTLINNARNDTTPYLLTANHCIRTSGQAASAVFYFDYETDTCGKKVVSSSYTLSGSTLLATSDSIDFTLLKLSETPPESRKPYYAGWSLSQIPATSAVCIHHPQGDPKKISIENDLLTAEYQDPIPPALSWLVNGSLPNAFWRVTAWDKGTTEGGSSGSPLFNQNKLIIGNLTGGDANCTSSINDYFSKFYVGWNHYPASDKQLRFWLDPDNTGIANLHGFNPYGPADTSLIDTVEFANRYVLFPNPAYASVTFETDSQNITGGIISIYSITGKRMARYPINDQSRLTFDVSFLEQGIYIVEFSKESIRERKRLIIINGPR